MFLDAFLEFADAVSVGTPNNTTVNVGTAVDLHVAGRDIGGGKPLYVVVLVSTAITSGGAATVRAKLASDSTDPPSVDGTQSEHLTGETFPVASLVAGFPMLVAPLPSFNPTYERYLGIQIEETAGQALTAGAINAFLTTEPRRYTAYADAQN